MTVGGWFDAEDLYGPLHTYQAVEAANPDIENTLVMGPWRHGGWIWTEGDTLAVADFGFKTSKTFQERALLPFFRHHLKGEGDADLPEAWVFETGANRWREFPAWPPENLEKRRLHLADGEGLSFDPPSGDREAFDEYVSDPANPVPYTPEISTGWHSEYMAEDQRFAGRRPDVLEYRSAPLEEDLTLAGPLTAELWVSTTGSDADWVVKLIDEYPDRLPGYDKDSEDPDLGGTQQMVRSETLRGRYRNSLSKPEPFEPGKITPVTVELQDVLHTFKRGHRVVVQKRHDLAGGDAAQVVALAARPDRGRIGRDHPRPAANQHRTCAPARRRWAHRQVPGEEGRRPPSPVFSLGQYRGRYCQAEREGLPVSLRWPHPGSA